MTLFGASSAESLFDYLIPLAIMVLYFFLNSRKRKQKQRPEQPPERSERTVSAPKPPLPPKPTSAPKRLEEGKLVSAVVKERSALRARSVAAPKKKIKISPAARLLKKASLRDDFLLSEILKPPYK